MDSACAPGSEVSLDPADARHARLVLRLHPGDPIVVVHDGLAYDAALITASGDRATVRLEAERGERGGELPAFVTVLQAITKGTKFEEVVEKTVELGARRIVPVRCERSYGEAGAHKLERWRRIARAAAMQSRRRFLPVVDAPLAWSDAVQLGRSQPVLIAHEAAQPGSLVSTLAKMKSAGALSIAVGAEGGLTGTEIRAAREAGCALVSLGPTILRTETAAAALLAASAALLGWW